MKLICSTLIFFGSLVQALAQTDVHDSRKHFQYSDTSFEVGEVKALRSVYFDFDQATMRTESVMGLDSLVDFLKTRFTMRIEVSHHTEYSRTLNFNLEPSKGHFNKKLSKERAKAVCEYLIAHGISKERLSWRGWKQSPLQYVHSDFGMVWMRERGTQIKITCLSNK